MNNTSSMPESLAKGRSLLAIDISPSRRKKLGQCFTGLRTSRLLAAISLRKEHERIVDPMAGHGDLLEAVAERAAHIDMAAEELVGVEIEPHAAHLGEWRVERCADEFGFRQTRFVLGDAFASETWHNSHGFDLVITNPPYVRYQTLSKGTQDGDVRLMSTEATRIALQTLAGELAPQEERSIWERLIGSYSGLADLSLPSWLLCGLLTAPSGILALVVPQTWLNRDYARIIRYFFLRFFQPMAVVQESGQRWFRDVLVPVSLVVGRRLPQEQILTPLTDRSCVLGDTPFVEVRPEASSEHSHVGTAFTGHDPEGQFADWLQSESDSPIGVSRKFVPWQAQRDNVLSLSRETHWLKALEGKRSIRVGTDTSLSAILPSRIAHLLPGEFATNVRLLRDEPLRTGQGLRTGCNGFFYVDVTNRATNNNCVEVLTSALLGRNLVSMPESILRPVLRRQTELTGIQIRLKTLHGRLLDLRGWVLPEDAHQGIVSSDREYMVMPKELAQYVRLAANTYLVRGRTHTLIPSLSAVRPNGLGPSEAGKVSCLATKNALRMWYMIPDFAPRHMPSLCIPRIIHDEPRAFMNTEPPVLVDANFSSLWCEGHTWHPATLLAILNSTWGELCMEALGSSLGGGALKLEATHLRHLPVPKVSKSEKEQLRDLAIETLKISHRKHDFHHCKAKTDQVIVSALMGHQVTASKTQEIILGFSEIIQSLRTKRRRKL